MKPVVNLRSKCAVLLSVVDWQVANGTYSTHRGVAMKAAVEALLGSQWGEGWVDKPLSGLTSTALKDMRSHGLGALAPGPILGPARLGEPWPLPYKLSDGRLESDYYRRLRQLLGAVSAETGVTVEEIKAPERRNTRKSNLAAALKEVLAFQFATNQPTYLAVERCVDQQCEEGRIGPVSASAYKTGALPFVRRAIETGLLVKGASQLTVSDFQSWSRWTLRYRPKGFVTTDDGVFQPSLPLQAIFLESWKSITECGSGTWRLCLARLVGAELFPVMLTTN